MMSIDDVLKRCNEKAEDYKEKMRRDYCKKVGFNENGYTWIATEDVISEEDRLEFRSKSGWFDRFLGWHSPRPIDGFKTVKVHMDEVAEWHNGRFVTRRFVVDEIRKKAAAKNLTKKDAKSRFLGEVGKDLVVDVYLDKIVETPFKNSQEDVGGMENRWDFFFKDKEGNILKFSSAWYDPVKVKEFCGKKVTLHIEANVYRHSDGFGRKETWISFPKISKRGGHFLKDYARMHKKDHGYVCDNASDGNQFPLNDEHNTEKQNGKEYV